MTTSLRTRLVDAGARAIEDEMTPEMLREQLLVLTPSVMAEAALDAMLDCLTENADEWFDAWTDWQDEDGDPKFFTLLDELREDR